MTSETTKKLRQEYSLLTGSLAYACLSGNVLFAVAVLALHLLQPERSPLNEAVSFYVHGAQGWLFTAGLLAWGGGSGALFLGLARTMRIRAGKAGLSGLAVWSAGVLTSGFFSRRSAGSKGQFFIGRHDSRKCGPRILYRPAHCRLTDLASLAPGSGVAPDRRRFVHASGHDHGQLDRVLCFVIADL